MTRGAESESIRCRFVANQTQTNSDPLPAGDACQCGDTEANGTASSADVLPLRNALASVSALSPAGANRCSVIVPSASCDVLDLVVLRRALVGQAPGIAQVCPAQFGP